MSGERRLLFASYCCVSTASFAAAVPFPPTCRIRRHEFQTHRLLPYLDQSISSLSFWPIFFLSKVLFVYSKVVRCCTCAEEQCRVFGWDYYLYNSSLCEKTRFLDILIYVFIVLFQVRWRRRQQNLGPRQSDQVRAHRARFWRTVSDVTPSSHVKFESKGVFLLPDLWESPFCARCAFTTSTPRAASRCSPSRGTPFTFTALFSPTR